MISNFRSREEVEAICWKGDKEEFSNYIGEENINWKMFTNQPSIPYLKKGTLRRNNIVSMDENIEIKIGDYIVLSQNTERPELTRIYSKELFEEMYEKL